jgi:hypothetical protein
MASLLAKPLSEPAEPTFVNDFVKLSLAGKEPRRLAPQLNPRTLDLALRALEQDERADPVHLPPEGAVRLLGRFDDLNITKDLSR